MVISVILLINRVITLIFRDDENMLEYVKIAFYLLCAAMMIFQRLLLNCFIILTASDVLLYMGQRIQVTY